MNGLAGDTAQGLRLKLQPLERDRRLAIDTKTVVGTMNALQSVANFIVLCTINIRDDSLNLVLASALTCIVGVLQQCLACRFGLRQTMQLRRAIAFKVGQP
jgi:hypothetical protein